MIKIILLCAGYATRLYPLTLDQPKPLLPIAGRPILEYVLDQVKMIDDVALVYAVTNHKFSGHFKAWARKVSYPWPLEIIDDQTTSNEDRLGAIGDLHYVLKMKNIGEEDIVAISGDNLFDFDLKSFVTNARLKRPHAVIAAFDVKNLELAKQYGLLRLDGKDGKVIEFLEKPENPTTTMASCGIYWLPGETRVLLDRYLKDGHNADQPGHYMHWLSQQNALYGIPLQGRWFDIGDLRSYKEADALHLRMQEKS